MHKLHEELFHAYKRLVDAETTYKYLQSTQSGLTARVASAERAVDGAEESCGNALNALAAHFKK